MYICCNFSAYNSPDENSEPYSLQHLWTHRESNPDLRLAKPPCWPLSLQAHIERLFDTNFSNLSKRSNNVCIPRFFNPQSGIFQNLCRTVLSSSKGYEPAKITGEIPRLIETFTLCICKSLLFESLTNTIEPMEGFEPPT